VTVEGIYPVAKCATVVAIAPLPTINTRNLQAFATARGTNR